MHKTLINNKKVNLILGIIIGLTFFVALAVFARNFIYDNSPNNDSKNEMASTSQTVTETPVKSKSKIDIAIEKCNDLPNAFEKMCLIKLVDIVAKEREWKQRKIEEMDLNQYEINE